MFVGPSRKQRSRGLRTYRHWVHKKILKAPLTESVLFIVPQSVRLNQFRNFARQRSAFFVRRWVVIKVSQGCPEELKNLWFAFDDEQRFVGVGKTEQDALRNLESAARTLKRPESPTQNAE